jgi:hypothetical protein
VVVARLKGDAPRANEVNPAVTEQTAEVIARMMDPTPARRFPTYQSMQADLQEAMDAAQRAASDREKAQAKPVKKTIVVPLTIGLTLALVGGVVGGYFYFRHGGAAPSKPPVTSIQALDYDPAQVTDRTPFMRGASMQVASAVTLYKPGSYIRAFADLNKLVDGQERRGNRVAVAWLNLYQGLMLKLEGDTPSLKSALQKLVSDGVQYAGNPPPVESPEVLARYMLRLVDEKTLLEKTAGAEAWYADLRNFVIALQSAQEGKTARIETLTAEYRTRAHSNHWAYAFRAHAVDLARHAAMVGPKNLAELTDDQKRKLLADIEAAGGFPMWKANAPGKADAAW